MYKIKNIIKATWKHWREISFVYLIQLIVGSIVGFTFCAALCSSFDTSMVLDHLAKGFDRTVIMDVMNSNDNILDNTMRMGWLLLGIYLIISVLLQAGWLANIKVNNFTVKSMLANGLKFFFPFLGIALISILLIIIYVAVVGFGFTKIVGDPLVTFSSEKPYVIWIIVLVGTFILWSITIWSWSVSTRFHYINGSPLFTSLKLGFNSVWNSLFKFIGIGLLLVAIHIILMCFYYLIMGDRGAPSWAIVIIGIFVQQIFAFTRVAIRGLGYGMVEDLNSFN